jgi:hypothetical protein
VLENRVESALVRGAKKRGVWAIKSERLLKGFPDRMLLAPGGRIAFVELKRPGQKLRPLQALIQKMLRKLGFLAVKLDHPNEAETFFEEWLGE